MLSTAEKYEVFHAAAHIQVLLGWLEHKFPPGKGRHHSITLGINEGREALCLNLWIGHDSRVLYLEGDDLNKFGDELVPVIRAVLHI